MIGEIFGGKYSVVRLLGQGGMGCVYEARHVTTGRRVALKVMTDEVKKHPAQLARFERETRAAGTLDSQYIAQVLDGGLDPQTGSPFLVMELLSGSDLDQLERNVGPLGQDLAVRITAQACMGLGKAHAAGIVHRDIKPGNMFLAEREEDVVVKLLDFGVAKVSAGEEDATSLTQTGSLIGTPLFMSPEQAAGEKTIDVRSDVWSLGVVLYQSLAGRTPHHDVTTIGKLILRICSQPAPSILDFAPWVSPALAELVHRSIEIEPSARFQSTDAMLAALRTLAPDGFSIRVGMLAGASDEERGRRSNSAPPRVAQSADDVARERTSLLSSGERAQIAGGEPPKDLVRTTSASTSDPEPGRDGKNQGKPAAKSATPLIALAAVATFGVAGVLYFGFLRGDASGRHAPSAESAVHAAATDDGPGAAKNAASSPTSSVAGGVTTPSEMPQITPGSAAEASQPPPSAAPSASVNAPVISGTPRITLPPPAGSAAKKRKPTNDPTSAM